MSEMKKEKIAKTTTWMLSLTLLAAILSSLPIATADFSNTVDYNFDSSESADELGVLPPFILPDLEPPELPITVLPPFVLKTSFDYMLFDDHGGWWYDAEKTSDNDDDDLLCWAAAASNALEWTGWGSVSTFEDTDDMFHHYQYHWYDKGGWMRYAWEWWFNSSTHVVGGGRVDVAGGGNYWPSEDLNSYYHQEVDMTQIMTSIDSFLHSGYLVTLGIRPTSGSGGHAVTVWGYRYNLTDYTGLWITDSDDNKGSLSTDPPPNRIRLYDLEYDSTNSRWEMSNYGGGWYIEAVQALAPRSGGRPVADANGPYIGYEGSPVIFSGAGSSDPDGDSLSYRWDFDADGFWDTPFSTSPTTTHTWNDDYTGPVLLEVYDGVFKDVDQVTVTINNVAPNVNAGPDQTVNEGSTVNFDGSYTDPGINDSPFEVKWNFGDGTAVVSGTSTPTHIYKDNGEYTVTFTVTDADGGEGSDQLKVTVLNVAPSITVSGSTIIENDYATVSGTISDPGILDTFQVTINWKDGVSLTYSYPAGSTVFSETHQYLDDNPTETPSDNYSVSVTVTDDDSGADTKSATVTVNNATPTINSLSTSQPNPQFILASIHSIDFTGQFTDVGSLDTHVYEWNFGDGSPTSTGTVSGSVTASHIFSVPGDYTITLKITDDDTGANSYSITVHVVTVEEALEDTNMYIQGLSDSCFKNKAAQTKNTIDNIFSAVIEKISSEDYNGAINSLINNVRAKADGLVDGQVKNDWIIDSDAQQEICMKIDDIVEYLKLLL